jgi:signal transduction histidine kinase
LPLSNEVAAAYTVLFAVNGEPVLLLRAEEPRSAYQNAQTATRTLAIYLLLLGVVFGGLAVILIDRFVLRRLAQLEASVRHITDSGDLSARVPVTAHDELSSLAHSINNMLAAREQAQQENVRLYDAARHQLGELSLLHTAAIATARSASLDAALQEIAQSVYDAFEAVNTMVILCEPDWTNLKIRASVGVPAETLAARQFKEEQGIIGAVAQTGQAILVNDVARDPRYFEADVRTRAELCAPLKIGERVMGMINVESNQLNAFTTDDLQLLQTLAHNLSTIVENLRLLEELRAANERLTELDRLKNQFVANMSHELRTPLNAILGFSELLLDEVPGPLNDEQRDYTQHINTSGQHLLALINDILDLSKLQANRIDLERRTTYFADIAAAAQTFVWPDAQRRRQTLIIDVPPDLPSLYVDPLRVKQVLINLLNNASKFTPPEGRITVHAEVWREDWLRASVSDTGPGIPPDKQAAIFEEFAQFNWERPVVERGTGLGLAIARRLVELHGGQIWIESAGQPGLGATFYFTLPLADAATMPRQTGTRLLIVDDDPLIIELLQSILPLPEYEVFGITDPAQVIDRVLRDKPDVIVFDLLLPDVDAFEILSALRARGIPIIALTARTLSADERAEIEPLVQAVLPRTQLRREALINLIQQVRQTTTPP